MYLQFLNTLKDWAMQNSDIECVLIVGSYARGTNTASSDIDVCIITTNKAEMIKKPTFANHFGNVKKLQTEYYGACTSLRVWYSDNREIEFGLVEPSWMHIPLDSGTRQVLQDGYNIIIDKMQYFNK